jgi:hypothetical protein
MNQLGHAERKYGRRKLLGIGSRRELMREYMLERMPCVGTVREDYATTRKVDLKGIKIEAGSLWLDHVYKL